MLKDNPKTRNSDIYLTLAIWHKYYPQRLVQGQNGELMVRLRDIMELPREDNVKRIRAHFQNDLGMYLPTDEKVPRQRKLNMEAWRAALGYPSH